MAESQDKEASEREDEGGVVSKGKESGESGAGEKITTSVWLGGYEPS